MKHDLQALKKRLPVAEAWTLLGLPGTPRPTCQVDFYSFAALQPAGGQTVKDLNDAAKAARGPQHALSSLLP